MSGPVTDDAAHLTGPSIPADEVAPTTHIDALIAECRPGLSVREIERQEGIPQGSLAAHLKPRRRGQWPTWAAIQAIAKAIGASVDAVSVALARDSGVQLRDVMTPDQRRLVTLFEALSPQGQVCALRQLEQLCEYDRATRGNDSPA